MFGQSAHRISARPAGAQPLAKAAAAAAAPSAPTAAAPGTADMSAVRDTAPPAAAAAVASRIALTPGRVQRLGVGLGSASSPTSTASSVVRGGERGGYVYVPAAYRPGRPAPLVVMLHGAGGRADPADPHLNFGGLQVLEASGTILVVPESRGSTWDVIRGGFGPDVAHVNAALQAVFAACSVDAGRIGLAGFSDGASYALSLGLGNGNLFTHIVAFSPGFMRPPPGPLPGRPRVYVSHGTSDPVLPVDCSRRIVPRLRQGGYEVGYHEFDGGHTIPAAVAQAGLQWVVGGSPGGSSNSA